MNDALNYYEEEKKVFTVSGYSNIDVPIDYKHSIYFAHISTSWGWATWTDRWATIGWENDPYLRILEDKRLLNSFCRKVGNQRIKMLKLQMDGEIDSWAVRRLFTQLLQDKLTLFPKVTLVNNIGVDGSGVHCGTDSYFDKGNLLSQINLFERVHCHENRSINKRIYNKNHVFFMRRLRTKVKRILKGLKHAYS